MQRSRCLHPKHSGRLHLLSTSESDSTPALIASTRVMYLVNSVAVISRLRFTLPPHRASRWGGNVNLNLEMTATEFTRYMTLVDAINAGVESDSEVLSRCNLPECLGCKHRLRCINERGSNPPLSTWSHHG